MDGPKILAKSMSTPQVTDQFGNLWQYHSRSDQHSKVACWALLFDLLHHCPLLRHHIKVGKIGFGINHEMRDFKNNRSKDLDLVICTPGPDSDESCGRGLPMPLGIAVAKRLTSARVCGGLAVLLGATQYCIKLHLIPALALELADGTASIG